MKPDTKWSARSQRSILQEHDLQSKLQDEERHIAFYKRSISEGEQSGARLISSQNAARDDRSLRATITKLNEDRHILVGHEGRAALLREEIKKLTPSPSELKARTEQQAQLAAVIIERLEKDVVIDKGLEVICRMLHERAELTAKITESAAALDISADDLDARRFEQLLASLPADLSATSEEWGAWVAGKPKKAKPYIVRDKVLMIPETLAHHGVHHRGEIVELTEEQARELLRENRPAPTDNKRWHLAPPSIMTVEAHQAAVAKTEEKGGTLDDVIFWQDMERDAEAKTNFLAQTGPEPENSERQIIGR